MHYQQLTLIIKKIKGKSGQVSLETTLALIATFVLVIGGFGLFVEINRLMVRRQIKYEDSRDTGANQGARVDMSAGGGINIFDVLKRATQR